MNGTSHEILARYLPALMVMRANQQQKPATDANIEDLKGAVLHVSVDGFEQLAEVVGEREPEKALAMTNTWFGKMVRMVAEQGGDIIHLSPRTLIAVWFQDEDINEDLTSGTLRAGRCALQMQEAFAPREVAPGVTVGLRIGIGCGAMRVIFVGGLRNRWESAAVGTPVLQAEAAADAAPIGQVLLERAPWTLIRFRAAGGRANETMARLEGIKGSLPPIDTTNPLARDEALDTMWMFTPGPVRAAIAAKADGVAVDRRVVSVIRLYVDDILGTPPENLQRAFEEMQAALYRHEGTLLHFRASGRGATVIAVLGLPPLPHADDPSRATAVALEAFRAFDRLDVAARVGVATGPAVVGDIGSENRRAYIVMGEPVRHANELAKAAIGCVLSDPETFVASQSGFEFASHAPVPVRGGSLQAHRAVAVVATGSSNRRPLVGRKQEVAQLVRVLEMLVRRGRPRTVVVIDGPAGIGKSRLLAHVIDEAVKRNLFPLLAHGEPIDGRAPYHAFAPIMSRVLGLDGVDVNDIGPERITARLQSSPQALHFAPLLNDLLPIRLPENEATAQLLGGRRADATQALVMDLMRDHAEGRPTVLAIDDSQFVDSESWDLAERALNELEPVMLILTVDTLDDGSPTVLRRLLDLEDTVRISLDRVSSEDAAAIIANALGVASLPGSVARTVAERSQGMPLMCEQIARHLVECRDVNVIDGMARISGKLTENDIPETVEAVIQERIARLADTQRTTLEVASVVGLRFTFELLHDVFPGETDMMVLGDDLEQLARLEFAPIAQREPEEIHQFRHELIRKVVYEAIPVDRRRQLHAAVGAWYEQSAGDAERPSSLARLAMHAAEAGESEKAAAYVTRAADYATRAGAWEQAVQVLTEGIAKLGTTASARVAARWERQIAESHYRSGQIASSRSNLESALTRLQAPVPPEGFAQTRAIWHERAKQGIPAVFAAGATDAAGQEAVSEQIKVEALLSELAWQMGDHNRALLLALRAVNNADRIGPSADLVRAYTQLALVTAGTSGAASAESYANRALDIARKQASDASMAPVLGDLGAFFAGTGRWDDANGVLDTAIALATENGETEVLLRARDAVGTARFARADYTGASEVFETNEKYATTSTSKVRALAGQAESLMRTGWLDQAEALSAEAEHWMNDRVPGPEVARLFAIRSLSRFRRKDWNGARGAAMRALKLLPDAHAGDPALLEAYGVLAEILVLEWERTGGNGRGEVKIDQIALDALSRLQRFAAIHPIGEPRYLVVKGANDWRDGAERRALNSFRTAADRAEAMGMPYEAAFARLELGRRLGYMDTEGRKALTMAERSFSRIGANLERDRCILALEGR